MGSSSPDTEGMSISCRANSTGRNPSPLAIRSVGPGILRVGVRSTGPSSAACRRATVSRARASSTTNVRFTREAPCEMSEILMSRIVSKTRAAMPGVVCRPSPTTQMIARPRSTRTSPRRSSSSVTADRSALSSTLSETLTSDVVTTSTDTRWRSNTSNNARRNPWAPSIRAEVIWSTVIPALCAMVLTVPGDASASAATTVPGSSGARESRMRTGMRRRMAGSKVLGCRTFAPKYASSDASAYDSVGTVRALLTTRGSAVMTPGTSVQIWISRASSAAPTRAAV